MSRGALQQLSDQAPGRRRDVGLPPTFTRWFEARGWAPHAHQLAMLEAAQAGQSALLTAPTGGGKTLAGFLPSLVELAGQPNFEGLHTLYISPLKALATDIRRNLETPLGEMGLAITAEARTGDTPANRRARQRERASRARARREREGTGTGTGEYLDVDVDVDVKH